MSGTISIIPFKKFHLFIIKILQRRHYQHHFMDMEMDLNKLNTLTNITQLESEKFATQSNLHSLAY